MRQDLGRVDIEEKMRENHFHWFGQYDKDKKNASARK